MFFTKRIRRIVVSFMIILAALLVEISPVSVYASPVQTHKNAMV